MSLFMLVAVLSGACTDEAVSAWCPACHDQPPVREPRVGPRPVQAPPAPTSVEPRPANATCRAAAPPTYLLDAQRAFPHLPVLVEPIALARPSTGQYWYVVERPGRLRRFQDHPDVGQVSEVIDLRAEVDPRGDGGLVALARQS